jgi:hypothetical protein
MLMVINKIAAADPAAVFDLLPEIISKSANVAQGKALLSMVLGNAAKAAVPVSADVVLLELVALLDSDPFDQSAIPAIILQISNIKDLISDKQLLCKQMAVISKHRSSSEIVFAAIEDFAEGLFI